MGVNARQLQIFVWGLTIAVVAVAVVAWGQLYGYDLVSLSLYQIFPLLGLLAFSLMWAHYIASVVRQYLKIEKAVLSKYFDITSMMVLVLILAHPSLLALQRWRDGYGLPPGSELNYMGPMLKYAVILGMIALPLFLAYELRRFYSDRKWWRYVEYATDSAIVLIYIHALRLGGQIQTGWFRGLWIFYGVTLAGSLGYIYYKKLTGTTKPPTDLVKS